MSTCSDCEHWIEIGYKQTGVGLRYGECRRPSNFPEQCGKCHTNVWAAFDCENFKAKQDWAEKAMKRLEDFIFADMRDKNLSLAWVPKEWRDKVMNFFREEAAKAGVK